MRQNYNSRIIAFLFLQKYLPLHELMIWLHLDKKDILEITSKFSRYYSNKQEKYIDEIIFKKIEMPSEIIDYIIDKNLSDELCFDQLDKIFNASNEEIIKMVFCLLKEQESFLPIIGLKQEILNKIEKMFYIKKLDVPLFDNPSNMKKLLQLVPNCSIEELSLIFTCSPLIIENQLLKLGVGGYWFNENIRTNSPIFLNEHKDIYSFVELLYLLNNKNEKTSTLIKKLHTTRENLIQVLTHIDKISNDKNKIIQLIKNSNIILELKKENSTHIHNYTIFDILIGNRSSSKNFLENLHKSTEDLLKNKKRYLIFTDHQSFICKIIGKINNSILFKNINGDIFSLSLDKIKIMKKL